MTFEVVLKKGLGGPYYVEAADAKEARCKGLERFRFHTQAVDDWPIEMVVAEVKVCNKKAVQYA